MQMELHHICMYKRCYWIMENYAHKILLQAYLHDSQLWFMPARQQPEKSALGFTANDEMQFAEWCAFSAVRFCECVRVAGFYSCWNWPQIYKGVLRGFAIESNIKEWYYHFYHFKFGLLFVSLGCVRDYVCVAAAMIESEWVRWSHSKFKRSLFTSSPFTLSLSRSPTAMIWESALLV